MKQAAERLQQAVSAGVFLTDEPMSRHTTFRTGGPARIFRRAVLREKNLDAGAGYLPGRRYPGVCYLGNGSNLLVRRQRLPGRGDLHWRSHLDMSQVEGTQVRAGAGAPAFQMWQEQALDASLTGFEFAAGIPGTVGGAVVMNAGAYGGEMKPGLTKRQRSSHRRARS